MNEAFKEDSYKRSHKTGYENKNEDNSNNINKNKTVNIKAIKLIALINDPSASDGEMLNAIKALKKMGIKILIE